MVRLKNRYLLIQILYPSSDSVSNSAGRRDLGKTGQDANALFPAPSLVSIHAPTPDHITPQTLLRVLRAKVSLLFGDAGLAAVSPGLAIKYWSNATSTFIIRVARAGAKLLWAAAAFVRELEDREEGSKPVTVTKQNKVGRSKEAEEVVLRVLRLSGTIRKCEEEAVRSARALCLRVKGDDGQSQNLAQVSVESDIDIADDAAEDLGEVVSNDGSDWEGIAEETSEDEAG